MKKGVLKKSVLVATVALTCAMGICVVAGCTSSNNSDTNKEAVGYKVAATLQSEHYAVGFKSGDTKTAEAVNATLKNMVADGFVKELCEKYADQGIEYSNWCLEGDANAKADKTANVKLIVGFDAEYPPYGYLGSNGEYCGFDLDLAKEVCNRLGWEFSATPIEWNAKDALLNSGTITCIWNGFTYEDRETLYTWTDAYMQNSQVIVTLKSSSVSSIDDLAGKTVATQLGSAAQTLLEGDLADKTAAFKELVKVADYQNAFANLESGAVDAVVCDYSVAAYYMSK